MAKVIDVSASIEAFEASLGKGEIVQYGPAAYTGSRRCAICYKGDDSIVRRITVEPVERGSGSAAQDEANADALALAGTILARLSDRECELRLVSEARAQRDAAQRRASRAERRLALTVGAKRPQPHMQDMLLRSYGDSPQVWLYGWSDKDRGGSAFGYCFPSAQAFWADHPEYRPVEWGTDEHGAWMRLQIVATPETTEATP